MKQEDQKRQEGSWIHFTKFGGSGTLPEQITETEASAASISEHGNHHLPH